MTACTASRTTMIKAASWTAVMGNAVLAGIKISAGLISGSLAVVSDGIDSTTDVIISVITLFTAAVMDKPPDSEHPYGHGRAESVATMILAFIILFVGAQLLYTTGCRIWNYRETALPSMTALYATVLSIAGKVALALVLFRAGKRTGSLMLTANGKNMLGDIFISGGVLTGLVCSYLFNTAVIDLALALAVSMWIIKTAVEIFMEIATELMEGLNDPELYKKIFEAVKGVPGAQNPHRTRVRKLAHMYVIDIDIEVDGDLTVKKSHAIAMAVEEAIKQGVENVYDIVVHVEPMGNVEHEEKYGLSENR